MQRRINVISKQEIRHVILIALFLTFLSTTIIATFLSIFPSSLIVKIM